MCSSDLETAGMFAQNAQTSASSASQSRQYAATSAQQANDSALNAGQSRDDAIAAAGLAEEQAGIATAAADRADPDGFRDGIDQRVSTVEGLVDGKADKSHTHSQYATTTTVDGVSGRVSSLENSEPIIVSSLPASPLPGRIYLVTG